MTAPTVRFACQTYSWQMSLDTYRGRVEHMAGVVARAGFAGFEPETLMLGERWTGDGLRSELRRARIDLAALCLVGRWRAPHETDAERAEADAVIGAVAAMPGSVVNLVVYPGSDREQLRERQDNALACMSAIARRAEAAGVVCSFHPNSPAGSAFRTAADYDYLLHHLDPLIGFTPDVGHIAKGGMDPVAMIAATLPRIRHVHIKDIDADGSWAPTGRGVLDIPALVDTLVDGGYRGWIAFEDESPLAERDPDAAVLAAGAYVRDFLAPRYLSTERSR
jgi:inosose dehydratase